jgi:hypothetical protein
MQPPVKMAPRVGSSDFADVDTILDQAITAGDPLIAAEYGNGLTNSMRLKGVALAKLFFGMKSNWHLFQAAGIEEDFPTFVDAHMHITGRIADKYADMYQAVLANPEIPLEVREQLKLKPIQSLLLLTAAVREGSLDAEDLEDVVVLDYNGVRSKVREARGDATNSHTTIFARLVQRDNASYPKGSIVVFGPGSDIEAIGMLNINPRTESGKKYLQRIINKLGLEDMSYG